MQSLKKQFLKQTPNLKEAYKSVIQPFKQLPSVEHDQENAQRISAHELFSHYTAEIIKEDLVFVR